MINHWLKCFLNVNFCSCCYDQPVTYFPSASTSHWDPTWKRGFLEHESEVNHPQPAYITTNLNFKKLHFQKWRWLCNFPPRKAPVAQKHRAIFRREKMAFSTSPSGGLGTPLPFRQSLYGRMYGRTLTSQPKFLGSIGYQICLALELHWRACQRAPLLNF